MTTHAPLGPAQIKSAPTWRAAWSDRTAALLAGVCDLAYADRTAMAQGLQAGGFALAAASGRWLLAMSPNLAVLAFRGTADPADWRVDLSAELVPLHSAPGVRVHRGFLQAYTEDRPDIELAIGRYLPPTLGLYVTGHSLGGALAQIATATLDGDHLAACYTFGSPRVATEAFDRVVRAPHYRVVNGVDLVPGLPAPWFQGYRHTGDPRLLTGDGVAAYRRARSPLTRLAVDFASLATVAVTHKLPIVDDHMITAYRTRLDAIVSARTPQPEL